MAYQVVIVNKAHLEIQIAYDWYQEQQLGVGDKFLNELNKNIKSISQNPYIFKCDYKNLREVKCKRYPFLIVYYINETKKEIIILAVFHTSRNTKNKIG